MNKKREIKIPPEDSKPEQSSSEVEREGSYKESLEDDDDVSRRTKLKRFLQKFELSAEAPQNILTAGLWQIVGTLISSVLGWLLIVIVSREDLGLGAGGVGVLNTALAFFGIFSLLTLGMSKATSQIVSENLEGSLEKREAFEHARNGTFITILTGIIIGVTLIVSSFFLGDPFSFTAENTISSIFLVIGVVMLVTGIRDGFISNLAAVGEYDDIAKAAFTNPLAQVVSGIIIIILITFIGIPVGIILLVYIFGIVVQTLFLYKSFGHLPFNTAVFEFTQVDRRAFHIARQGFYFAITDIIPVGLVGSVATIILLAFTQNYQIVGAYSVVLGYSFGGLLVTGFTWPIITTVAEAYGQKDTERIHYYLHLVVKLFFYITFLVLAFNIVLSRGILFLFHGPSYLTGVTDVWIPFILVFTAFSVAAFEYILCGILLGIGKGRPAAAYLGGIFLVTIGLVTCFVWLSPFGVPQIDAAAGFLTGTIIMLPLLPFIIKRYIVQGIPGSVGVRSLMALICTIIVGALLSWPPFELLPLTNIWTLTLVAIIVIVLFPVLLAFFGAISEEDYDLLERKMEAYGMIQYVGPVIGFLRKISSLSPISPVSFEDKK